MSHPILLTATAFTLQRRRLDDLLLARRRAVRTDRGEGVLSAAIAVLIFAFLGTMMWFAKPFLQQVFLAPMDRTDPSGRRIHEAFKRIQLVLRKPTVARSPFSRMMIKMQELYNRPIIGKLFGRVFLRVLGAEDRAARILFTQDELKKTMSMSFDELAEEALALKYS